MHISNCEIHFRCLSDKTRMHVKRRCGEMVDATDLKSVGPYKARAGSSPAIGNSYLRSRIADCRSIQLSTKVLEDDHSVADADEVFHSCGVPVCQANATVTCRSADRLRIIRA